MILQDLHIDGFGVFNKFKLTDLESGVNIILGDNEAGKSTLLHFIRYTLFGYPSGRENRPKYKPLRGGKHGGRIKALTANSDEVVFERFGDNTINLDYKGEIFSNKDKWQKLLGGAYQKLFDNIYAFSLEELFDFSSLDESGVEDKIFSVGMGLGKNSLSDIRANIANSIENIYLKGGKKGDREIPAIVTKMQNIKKQLKEINEKTNRYETLISNIRDLHNKEKELKSEQEKVKQNKDRIQKYLDCYKSFVDVETAEDELDNLPGHKNYPPKGVDKLDNLLERLQELKEEKEDLIDGKKEEKSLVSMQTEFKNINYNQNLIEMEADVKDMQNDFSKFKKVIEDLKKAREKIKQKDYEIKRLFKQIGRSYTKQNIKAVSGVSNFIKHESTIRKFDEKLEDLKKQKENINIRLNSASESNSVNVDGIKKFVNIFCLALAIGSIGLLYYSKYIGSILVFLIAALIIWAKRFLKDKSKGTVKEDLTNTISELEQAQSNYQDYVQKELHFSPQLRPRQVLDKLEVIQKLQKVMHEKQDIENDIQQDKKPFIDKYQAIIKKVVTYSKDEKLSNKSNLFNSKKPPNYKEIEKVKQDIDSLYKQSQKALAEKENIKFQIVQRKKSIKRIEDKIQDCQQEVKKLLDAVNAEDEEDFRNKYALNQKTEEYLAQKKEALKMIQNSVGIHNVEELREYLKSHDKNEITERLRELKNREEEIDEKLGEVLTEIGKKDNEKNAIEKQSEVAALKTELESLRQKLNAAYKRWLTGKIALTVLREVQTQYEEEKQPDVISNASKHFKEITSGRYEKVQISLADRQDQEVYVHPQNGPKKKLHELSRGTKEQLLLSLRLGFIEEYEKETEPLPLIVDDILVNFDPTRARQTAQVLKQFASDRQLLFFTCHPNSIDTFGRDAINKLEIRDGEIL